MDAGMTELSGTLDGIGLQPLLGFLGGLRTSGNLIIEDQDWSGILALVDGQLVGATFGRERGLEALDAIFFALQHGRFAFRTSDSCDVNLVMEPTALADHMQALGLEVAQLARVVPSLGAVPRILESGDDGEVTLGRSALRLLLALDGRRTVAEHARERSLLMTLRELAELAQLGLITTDATVSQTKTVAPSARAAEPAAAEPPGRAAEAPSRVVEMQARAAEQRRRGIERNAAQATPAEPADTVPTARRFWR
jgi:hypothetical protein